MSRLPLSPVIFIVITVILFAAEYSFQASKQPAVIFGSSLGTLEKMRSQKEELVTWCRAIFGGYSISRVAAILVVTQYFTLMGRSIA